MSELANKTEKLASAIYLISGFFSDQEPLKWKLRTLASELVSLTASLKDNFFKEKEATISETRNLILKIIGLLSVAKNVGLISLENHDLMKGEFIKYVGTLDSPVNLPDLLKIELPSPKLKETREIGGNLLIKDRTGYELSERKQIVGPQDQKEKSLKEFGAVSVKKNSRQSIIVAILKRKKEIMIKDVSSLINGCSEKTIQRELSTMVREGLLKKVGEKRWSRYSLA